MQKATHANIMKYAAFCVCVINENFFEVGQVDI